MEEAEKIEALIMEQKGWNNFTTRPLNKRRDLIGCLAQYGMMDLFELTGLGGGLNMSAYFDPDKHSDSYDFEYRGTTYDVKGSPMRKFKYVTGKTTVLVSDHQQDKRVGAYVFCQVDIENNLLHYPGYIDYDKFWSESVQATGDWLKSPCHLISVDKLTPMGEMFV